MGDPSATHVRGQVWTCRCGGKRKVLAVITSRRTAEEILGNMGLRWATTAAPQRPRASPAPARDVNATVTMGQLPTRSAIPVCPAHPGKTVRSPTTYPSNLPKRPRSPSTPPLVGWSRAFDPGGHGRTLRAVDVARRPPRMIPEMRFMACSLRLGPMSLSLHY